MECKDECFYAINFGLISINRNIVECKAYQRAKGRTRRGVLIETLWNVKGNAIQSSERQQGRINRNIVECKAKILCSTDIAGLVLIETLWNVKTIITTNYSGADLCINRNIVECKDSHTASEHLTGH